MTTDELIRFFESLLADARQVGDRQTAEMAEAALADLRRRRGEQGGT